MGNFNPSNKIFSVDAYDNFKFPHEYDWLHIGGYDDLSSAITVCKLVIDEFYIKNIESNDNADSLFNKYLIYGEVPCITGDTDDVRFTAQDYAMQRSKILTNTKLSQCK